MDKDPVRFLHLSDTHFGVHYALKPRNLLRRAYGELFFRKAEDVIREAISIHKIDFIIHSGDFFNRSKPPPEVVDRGVRPFQLVARKGIPVFLIPGNHERSRLPIGLLPFSNDNINLFAEPCSYLFQKNGVSIKITGFPHIRHKAGKTFPEILKTAWNNCSCNSVKHDFSILVVHQLFAGSRVENYTFRRGVDVVPMFHALRKFNYIACGHVHRFQFLNDEGSPMLKSATRFHAIKQDHTACKWNFGDESRGCPHSPSPVTAYAGSLERVSIQERNEPKGYLIGELQPSTTGHRMTHSRYQFHEVSAVKMMHTIWDLSNASLNDCISRTLKEMYDFHSTYKSNRSKPQNGLVGIIRVRIQGRRAPSNTFLDHLKQEAQRLRFYLTFRMKSQSSRAQF